MSDYLGIGYDGLLRWATEETPNLAEGNQLGIASSDSTPNPTVDYVEPSFIASGTITGNLTLGRNASIFGGATYYNEGNGWWLGRRTVEGDAAFFIGNSAGDKLTYNTIDGLIIVGAISASSIHIPDENTTASQCTSKLRVTLGGAVRIPTGRRATTTRPLTFSLRARRNSSLRLRLSMRLTAT